MFHVPVHIGLVETLNTGCYLQHEQLPFIDEHKVEVTSKQEQILQPCCQHIFRSTENQS